MRFFSTSSPEQRFWSWFVKHSDRLFEFERDQEAVFDALNRALGRVHRGLTFEFGPVQNGRREFIVSADGIQAVFPAVRALVAAAPLLPRWVVIPFRPPKDLALVIEMGGCSLGPDDVWFTSEPDGTRVGLHLFIRGLTDANANLLGNASFILLDNALGEYEVETRVGFIERQPLPERPESVGLRPFHTIRDHFDLVAH